MLSRLFTTWLFFSIGSVALYSTPLYSAPRLERWGNRTAYEVLGIPESASEAEIDRAFKNLAKRLHPDINPSDKSAEERFKILTDAHDVLKESRSNYDRATGEYSISEKQSRSHQAEARDYFPLGALHNGILRLIDNRTAIDSKMLADVERAIHLYLGTPGAPTTDPQRFRKGVYLLVSKYAYIPFSWPETITTVAGKAIAMVGLTELLRDKDRDGVEKFESIRSDWKKYRQEWDRFGIPPGPTFERDKRHYQILSEFIQIADKIAQNSDGLLIECPGLFIKKVGP